MEMETRYTLAQANLAERRALAERARLVKGDDAPARPIVFSSVVRAASGLRARLTGFRAAIHRPTVHRQAGPEAAPATR